MIPGKTYTPEEIVRIVWRGRWIVLACVVVCGLLASAVALYLPNQYRSETLVLVIPQRVPENYVQNTVTTRIEERVQSLREQLLSRSRLEPLIEEFNLYPEARKTEPMEDIIAQMRLNVTTRVVRGDAFTVSFVGDTPELAQKVTERLSSLFTEENMRDREVIAESTNQFLQTQLDAARQQLTDSEKTVQEYRRKFSGELPDQAESNLSAIQNAESQIQTLTESLNRDRERRLLLERQIAESSTPEASAPALAVPVAPNQPQTLEQQLDSAESRLREMQTRLTPNHPDVVQARLSVERLQKQVIAQGAARGSTDAAAPRVSATELARRSRVAALTQELQGLLRIIEQKQADEARFRNNVALYRRRLEAAPLRQSELTALTRDYDTLQRQYQDLLKKFEDSKVAANMERRQIGEQFRVLDPARVPEQPYTPNRKLLAGGGAFAGILLGLALIGLREFLDQTLRSARDVVASLDLPVLAALPVTVEPKPTRAWRIFARS